MVCVCVSVQTHDEVVQVPVNASLSITSRGQSSQASHSHPGHSGSVAFTVAVVADSLTTFLQVISGLHQQAALWLQLQLRHKRRENATFLWS